MPLPNDITPQIIQRQVGGFGEGNLKLYPHIPLITVEQTRYFNLGQERLAREVIAADLNLDLDAVRALINIDQLDSSARWNDLNDTWATLLRDGKENYQDEFFDSIRPILKRFPVEIRNKVAGAIIKSYNGAGSSIALRDDLLREAAVIQEAINSGQLTGNILQNKNT